MKNWVNQLNFWRSCKESNLSLSECPGFLFVLTGFITIIGMIGTYILTSYYTAPEIAALCVIGVTLTMSIIEYLVNRGVTKIAQARIRLRDTNKKLVGALKRVKQEEKMREDFISMIVHDLRSPLVGIRNIADVLQDKRIIKDQKRYNDLINAMEASSFSMLDLIKDLLDIAKIESGKFEILRELSDIREIIKEKVNYFDLEAEKKKIKLEKRLPKNLPSIKFDKKRIGQVIDNLLSNALKNTQSSEEIIIRAFVHKKGQAEKIQEWIAYPKKMINLPNSIVASVTDTGSGIPEKYLEKIFEKFQQVKIKNGVREGTGLGLAICKGIIKAHKGIIGVESKVGQGSTFYFILPIK